jgi:hypothetical protein
MELVVEAKTQPIKPLEYMIDIIILYVLMWSIDLKNVPKRLKCETCLDLNMPRFQCYDNI